MGTDLNFEHCYFAWDTEGYGLMWSVSVIDITNERKAPWIVWQPVTPPSQFHISLFRLTCCVYRIDTSHPTITCFVFIIVTTFTIQNCSHHLSQRHFESRHGPFPLDHSSKAHTTNPYLSSPVPTLRIYVRRLTVHHSIKSRPADSFVTSVTETLHITVQNLPPVSRYQFPPCDPFVTSVTPMLRTRAQSVTARLLYYISHLLTALIIFYSNTP